MAKCKRITCENEAPDGWWYCSRDCAPYGLYGLDERPKEAPKTKRNSGKQPKPAIERPVIKERPFGRAKVKPGRPKNQPPQAPPGHIAVVRPFGRGWDFVPIKTKRP